MIKLIGRVEKGLVGECGFFANRLARAPSAVSEGKDGRRERGEIIKIMAGTGFLTSWGWRGLRFSRPEIIGV
jgi:hypothetical protein